ncbi:Type II secretion system (T2SS), protein F [uncultured archaeon]|nr:Type II secretion system (T2SS), protein F [uncultured archaeon]
MKTRNFIYAGIGTVLIVFIFIFFNTPSLARFKYFLVSVIFVLMLLPFVSENVLVSKKQKEKDSKFLEFVRDLVENVKSGTPIAKAILNVQSRDYGALTIHVRKLGNQIALGIPLTTALVNFASDSKSPVIKRAVGLISEAERSGGQIDSILSSVSGSVDQTEKLKKEQRSAVFNLVVQGYIIFVIFILIVLVLQYLILPLTKDIGGAGFKDLNSNIKVGANVNFEVPLLSLLIVQSFFAGLVIGKISEGSLKDGIKHSFILIGLTLVISSLAALIFGGVSA